MASEVKSLLTAYYEVCVERVCSVCVERVCSVGMMYVCIFGLLGMCILCVGRCMCILFSGHAVI